MTAHKQFPPDDLFFRLDVRPWTAVPLPQPMAEVAQCTPPADDPPRPRGFPPTHDPSTDERLPDRESWLAYVLNEIRQPAIRAELVRRTGLSAPTINKAIVGLRRRGLIEQIELGGRAAYALPDSALVYPGSQAWNDDRVREFAGDAKCCRTIGPSYIGLGL